LVAFGKTPGARSSLARQFRELALVKTYLAWVEGPRLPDSFAARQPIAKLEHGPLQNFAAAERGKPSLTRVRVLRREKAAEQPLGTVDAARGPHARAPSNDARAERALVAAQPITGRPDQIRIHLAAAGAPIIGDPLFGPGGTPKSDAPPGKGGYLLHAAALSFAHPASGARVKLRSRPEWLAP
jgi:23S rRNA pseudouridine1911/1915/1917 synthase